MYAKQRAYKDAIECFEIAQSLEPSASSLHNVGLIYYETQDYVKAALAFEQALDMEASHAARHIAYAKIQEKLGNTKKMLAALEKAWLNIGPLNELFNFITTMFTRLFQFIAMPTIDRKIGRASCRERV